MPRQYIEVADLVIRKRKVELPNSCPHCGVNTSYGKGFRLCYLEYAYFQSKPGTQGEVDLDWVPDPPDIGADMPCVAVFCDSCGEEIFLPHMKELEAQEEEQVQENAFSASLQQMFFRA